MRCYRSQSLAVFFLLLITLTETVSARPGANKPESWLDIAYVENPVGSEQTLDIYLPANSHIIRKRSTMPVHVYVHGGAWTLGDKALQVQKVAAYTRQNIILVSLNYRLGSEHKYPANIQDLVAASNWIKSNIRRFGGNPDKMVLTGHSAGAHLVALFAVGTTDAPAPDSASIYKAIFPVDTASFDLTIPSEGKLSRLLNRQKKTVFGKDPETLRSASPIHQIESDNRYSRMHLFVTESRPDAVKRMQDFKEALQNADHTVSSQVISGGLSHKEMNEAIFDPSSEVYHSIIDELIEKK